MGDGDFREKKLARFCVVWRKTIFLYLGKTFYIILTIVRPFKIFVKSVIITRLYGRFVSTLSIAITDQFLDIHIWLKIHALVITTITTTTTTTTIECKYLVIPCSNLSHIRKCSFSKSKKVMLRRLMKLLIRPPDCFIVISGGWSGQSTA